MLASSVFFSLFFNDPLTWENAYRKVLGVLMIMWTVFERWSFFHFFILKFLPNFAWLHLEVFYFMDHLELARRWLQEPWPLSVQGKDGKWPFSCAKELIVWGRILVTYLFEFFFSFYSWAHLNISQFQQMDWWIRKTTSLVVWSSLHHEAFNYIFWWNRWPCTS